MFSCLTCNVTETLVRSFFQHYETWRIEKREKRINRLKAILDTYATQVIEGKRRTANNAESNNLGPNLISRSATSIPKTRTLLSLTQIHPDLITLLSEPITNQALLQDVYSISHHNDDEKNDDNDDIDYSYDKISMLKYAHAVAMESLRLHPSVPIDIKVAVKKDV